MSDQNDSNPATAEQKVVDYSGGPIVARSDPWYRMKQSVVVLICLGAGIWCLYDGFWKFPRENYTAIRRGQREWEGRPLNVISRFVPIGIAEAIS